MQNLLFDWRSLVWLALLVALSIGLSLGLACALPLAAFAALAGLTMEKRTAILLVLAIVLANQGVGLVVLHYPPGSLPWGAAFALVGVLGVLAAGWTRERMAWAAPTAVLACAFLAAFAAYEGGLFLITLASSPADLAPYAAPIVLRILFINAAVFAGLVLASRIAGAVGLAGHAPAEARMT